MQRTKFGAITASRNSKVFRYAPEVISYNDMTGTAEEMGIRWTADGHIDWEEL